MAFTYPQPGDVGGCRTARAGHLTATQLTQGWLVVSDL